MMNGSSVYSIERGMNEGKAVMLGHPHLWPLHGNQFT